MVVNGKDSREHTIQFLKDELQLIMKSPTKSILELQQVFYLVHRIEFFGQLDQQTKVIHLLFRKLLTHSMGTKQHILDSGFRKSTSYPRALGDFSGFLITISKEKRRRNKISKKLQQKHDLYSNVDISLSIVQELVFFNIFISMKVQDIFKPTNCRFETRLLNDILICI